MTTWNEPALLPLIPERGYVRGNVLVVLAAVAAALEPYPPADPPTDLDRLREHLEAIGCPRLLAALREEHEAMVEAARAACEEDPSVTPEEYFKGQLEGEGSAKSKAWLASLYGASRN